MRMSRYGLSLCEHRDNFAMLSIRACPALLVMGGHAAAIGRLGLDLAVSRCAGRRGRR